MANGRRIQLKRPVSARLLLARWILVGVLLGMASVGSLKAAKRETGFLNRRVTLNGETYRYQVYVPLEWNKGKKWPVILFLHGAGEPQGATRCLTAPPPTAAPHIPRKGVSTCLDHTLHVVVGPRTPSHELTVRHRIDLYGVLKQAVEQQSTRP